MSLSVHYHEQLELIQISQDGAAVFIRRDQASDLLSKFMAVLAATVPGGFELETDDLFSRKAPDVPALRLVGGDVA